MAPYNDMDSVELKLINASMEAGVKFFVPSEWGPDTAGGNGATTYRIGPDTLPPTPIIGMKRVVHNYLLARSGEGKIDFATLHTGNMLLSKFLLLYFISSLMTLFSADVDVFATIDVQKCTAILPDGGHHPFSVTSKKTLATALINLLSRYPENRNSFLYICDGEATMYQVVLALQKVSGTKGQWDVSSYSLEENKKMADANLKKGNMSLADFVGVLGVPFTGGLTVWRNPDNSKLGLEDPSHEKAQKIVEDVARSLLA
jgi:hypothetical protein